MPYYQGQTLDAVLRIEDSATEELVDPTTIELRFVPPTGDDVIYTIDDFTRTSAGLYTLTTDTFDVSGYWRWRLETTGPGAGVEEGSIRIRASAVLP